MKKIFLLLLLFSECFAQNILADGHYLLAATPGIRNYLGYGGHGLVVFDIEKDHAFVKRIATKGFRPTGEPSNVKGIAVSSTLNSVYISTWEGVQRIDMESGKIVWEIAFEGGCDRMAITPDGKTMYLPSLEKSFWKVVDCDTGKILEKIEVANLAHNTICGLSGRWTYLGDINSEFLYVVDNKTQKIAKKIGPLSGGVRPFTINGKENKAFITVNDLLGFEVVDVVKERVEATKTVEGWEKGPVRRHGNPSHGIGLTPDESEVWVADGHNMRMHVFRADPPYQQQTSIPLIDMPGWITFSMDGKYAYPSSGEVISPKSREVLYFLRDEFNNIVSTEKMVEVFIKNGKIIQAGDQFGLGRVLE